MASLREQIEAFGEEFNNLEERLAEVEGKVGEKETRIVKMEDRFASVEEQISRNRNSASDANIDARNGDARITSAPTDEVVQELVRRLGRGDILTPVLQRQLQASLQPDVLFPTIAQGIPPTPAFTTTASRPPTMESTSDSDVPLKRTRRPTVKARESSMGTTDSSMRAKSQRVQKSTPPRTSRKRNANTASPLFVSSNSSSNRPAPTPADKRTRKEKPTIPLPKTSETISPEQHSSSQSWSTEKVVESSETRKSEEMDVDTTGFGEDMIIPPDLRRSRRTLKTIEREDYVHWRDVARR